ncbi:hypothetical protein ABK040_012194 [Willaertia magna]
MPWNSSIQKYYEFLDDENDRIEMFDDRIVTDKDFIYNILSPKYPELSIKLFENISDDLWDEDYILKSLQKFVDIFPFINSTILCNSEFILKAIKANGEMAIESNHDAYCHLNEQDKLDKEYLTLAIKNHNYLFRSKVYKSIPNEMFNEMDIALTMLRNKETALVLVKHSPYVIRWLEVNLRNDEEIIIEIIKITEPKLQLLFLKEQINLTNQNQTEFVLYKNYGPFIEEIGADATLTVLQSDGSTNNQFASPNNNNNNANGNNFLPYKLQKKGETYETLLDSLLSQKIIHP